LRAEAPALQQIIADAQAKPQVRVNALRLMAAQHPGDPEFAAALKLAANKAAPVDLRLEALTQVFAHQPEQAAAEAARVLDQGTLVEKQSALQKLPSAKGREVEALLRVWMQKLMEGKIEAALKLDVLEAAQAHEGLADIVSAYMKSRTSPVRDDLLEGGNVTVGKDIVTNHLGANCLACHTVELKEGSEVGPNLKIIGSQRDRTALLESLVHPLAQIAPGYGLVSITLKDGSNVAGSLTKEDKDAVTVKLADGKAKVVVRSVIAAQTPPMSIMPPMLGILTPHEIRDAVAYLSSLKDKQQKKK
jgi:putative heme-binding domain-containing protein